ncbi:unnamed protein product [Allacma fusca]|uniref:Uncharacterized protein n=1 Tax=Allacma fusca TaxID=39272 RepID=A0A8J2JR76_9HEXA|nr:unnamed protein product [Allacma fusca]
MGRTWIEDSVTIGRKSLKSPVIKWGRVEGERSRDCSQRNSGEVFRPPWNLVVRYIKAWSRSGEIYNYQ